MSPRSRWAVLGLTLAYLGLAATAVVGDRFLHDEGLLTHLLASLVDRAPAATLLLQKSRPPLALLYAPVAGLGVGAFLWAHVLVSALAVPLVAATAARLGHARPELAAAVVALSPMHVAAGAAGLMNADAVVGLAVVALLWARQRWLAAGAVMGTLVWVRAELAVVALVLALWALWRRHPRMLLGLAAFPILYGAAGAVYHGELLWMLRFPPALVEPMAGNPYWESHHAEASLPTVAAGLLAITPALPLLATWRLRGAPEVERVGLLAVGLLATALLVLPRWQVFNFDLSPRYLLPVLPFAALAVSRAFAGLGPDDAAVSGLGRGLGLGLLAAIAIAIERLGGGGWALVAVGGSAGVAALAGAGWPRLAWLAVGGLVVLGPLAYVDGARLARRLSSPALDQAVTRLREHPEWKDRPIYTNEPLLDAYLERSGALPGRDVRYLVQADQLHELTTLANPDNGQREALLAALRIGFYGTPVLPDELTPQAVPPGAVLVLRQDQRLSMVMPPERWAPWLTMVHPGVELEIAVRNDAEAIP
ncbi:MAG: hypothetical protein H6712_12990 [Myxococcales bacterium]|nr:hypothetical protein [Myxococcales bacterium]